MRHVLTLSENVDRFFISLNSDNMVKNDIVERGGEMKRWIVLGSMIFFLSGCTNPLTPSPLPTELPPAPIEEWTREDFKDIYDEYDQVEPLLDALKKNGITPFRETFERVIIAAHGLEHTYANIYPFQLDDGTYATIYEGADGSIANGTESVAPLFWQETSFQQFVEEIENRKYGTSAPPPGVVLTKDEFQDIYNRHVYTSALLIELDEAGVQLFREPIRNMTISFEMRVEHKVDFLLFQVQDGYAVIFDLGGDMLKPPDTSRSLFWDEKTYEELIDQFS